MKSYNNEFETVDQILSGYAVTRRTDAFILTWVKMEKQLRRLFTFFAFQNSAFNYGDIDAFIEMIVKNNHLYFYSFQKLIEKLLNIDFENILNKDLTKHMKQDYQAFYKDVQRIKKYRNKIMHGQITGQKLQSKQIEKDINLLRDWIIIVGNHFQKKYGYDGLGRNTFSMAKNITPKTIINYPFDTISKLEQWIKKNA